MLHGEHDRVFPLEDVRKVREWFEAAGATVKLEVLEGRNHAFAEERGVVMRHVAEQCSDFFNHEWTPEDTNEGKVVGR